MKLRAASRTVSALVLVAGAVLAAVSHAGWTAFALTLAALAVLRAGTKTLRGAPQDQGFEAAAKALLERLAHARAARHEQRAATSNRAATVTFARNGTRAFLTPLYTAVRTDHAARWCIFFRDELPDDLWRRLAHEVTALRD